MKVTETFSEGGYCMTHLVLQIWAKSKHFEISAKSCILRLSVKIYNINHEKMQFSLKGRQFFVSWGQKWILHQILY